MFIQCIKMRGGKNMSEETLKISKEKSAMYPAYTINEVLESFVKIVDSLGSSKVSIETVAHTMGVSASTKSFTRKMSAARQYDLIEVSKGIIELTSLAKNILYPVLDDTDIYLMEAFKKPQIYEKLISRFNGRALPNIVALSNVLLEAEFSITKNVKDLVAQKFIDNCNDLGILTNGILNIDNRESAKFDNANGEKKENVTSEEKKLAISSNDYQEMSIPIPGKQQMIRILIPKDFDSDDYEFLQKYLEAVLPMYIGNLKNKNQA